MKKLVVLSVVVLFVLSVFSLDIDNMEGAFDLLKLDIEENSYKAKDSLLLRRNLSRNKTTIEYSVDTEKRTRINNLIFSKVGQSIYATFHSSLKEKTYVVIDNKNLYMKLVNIEDENDVLKLVYNKTYNDFDYEAYYSSLSNLKNEELKEKLHDLVDNHIVLSYKGARRAFFSRIDNFDGIVECVYTGKTMETTGIPNHYYMNCEHTWPQSLFNGGDEYAKKDDIFHLYPSDSKANSIRGHYPFGNVLVFEWTEGGSSKGEGEDGYTVFEPRDQHKGNVARSMFYFAIRYNMSIDKNQERVLRQWHALDPVDEKELARNSGIEMEQHNRNPFIDQPQFVEKISDF